MSGAFWFTAFMGALVVLPLAPPDAASPALHGYVVGLVVVAAIDLKRRR